MLVSVQLFVAEDGERRETLDMTLGLGEVGGIGLLDGFGWMA